VYVGNYVGARGHPDQRGQQFGLMPGLEGMQGVNHLGYLEEMGQTKNKKENEQKKMQ